MRAGGFRRSTKWALVAIVVLAIALRIWGINFGLPYLYHPDEPNKVIMAQTIFKTGDLNPHYFLKPSFLIYLNALAYVPYYLVGKLAGVFGSPADIPAPIMVALGVGKAPMPTTFLMGRIMTAIFGSAAVVLVFLLGCQLTNKAAAGLGAALMMAISPTSVAISRFITPDMMMVFFISLAVYGAVRVLQGGKTSHYVLAGVAAGLAASTKYYGALVLISVVVAHFMRCGLKGFREWKLYLAGVLSAATFFLITPFALLDAQKFLADLLYEARHYSTGHQGMEGSVLGWYLSYLWKVEGLVVLIAVLGILQGFYKRSREALVISSFPLAYFLFIISLPVRNDRTLLPVLPFLFMFASALAIGELEQTDLQWYKRRLTLAGAVGVSLLSALALLGPPGNGGTSRLWLDSCLPVGSGFMVLSLIPLTLLVAAFLMARFGGMLRSKRLSEGLLVLGASSALLVSLVWSLGQTTRSTVRLLSVDSRETARIWIDSNLPEGARVAVEQYSPFVDPQRFSVEGFITMIDHEPEWYVDNGFEYLVFGEDMFGRFYKEPDRYSNEVSRYEELFRSFYMVEAFTDGGYEVWIYATNPQGPWLDVMADFGEVVRLVEYYVEQDVEAGTSLRLELHWRRLAESQTQYSVFVHLIDEDWAMLGQSDGVPRATEGLTGGWGEGELVRDRRTISVPEDMPEGQYRLEIGIYDPKTMERLKVEGAREDELSDRILSVPIQIRK